jgi:hypothetical protein
MNARTLAIAVLALPLAALAQEPVPAKPATVAAPAPAPTPPAAAAAVVAARVVLVTGSVTATAEGGARTLAAGDAVYEGQTVNVGPNSYANLRFADGGRVLLRPNTEFAVESFRYSGPEPAAEAPAAAAPAAGATPADREASVQGTAFFRLVRGGFRAVTGLLGKANRQDYRVTTPAATIGIRGTDYEVQMCTTDCPVPEGRAGTAGVELASSSLANLQLAAAGGTPGGETGGIVVATNEGSIGLRTSRGEFVVDAGEVALAMNDGQTFKLPVVPDVLLLNATPSPEACE